MDFDFSEVNEPELYQISYGKTQTEPFCINNDVYKRHVWQPVLEYFLQVQMCHMRINDQYRVWHDVCHLDDALMAPVNLTISTAMYKAHQPSPNSNHWNRFPD